MADKTVVMSSPDQNPDASSFASEFDSLQFPQLDYLFFSDGNGNDTLNIAGEHFVFGAGLELGVEDGGNFELTFDDLEDLYLPLETEDFLIQDNLDQTGNSLERYESPESRRSNNEYQPTDSGGWNSKASKILICPSPEHCGNGQVLSGGPASSQDSDSGNCGSGVSEIRNYPSPDAEYCDVNVDQRIKSDEVGKNCIPKRKKELDEGNVDSRSAKYRRSSVQLDVTAANEDEGKRKAKLMRNRESAQLSRQRKKQYVEELEEKVRIMHTTIAELNGKISYIMAENAGLRQQLSAGGMCQPPPGMYPHPSVAYPWIPYPPYVVKSQGSQVPLVPIPRLKPQQPASVIKAKKNDTKKAEGKTKKVASVTFLGLLFFILLFGGLVPIVNVRFGNVGDSVPGKLAIVSDRFYRHNRGTVLRVDEYSNLSDGVNVGTPCGKSGTLNDLQCEGGYMKGQELKFDQRGQGSQQFPDSNEFIRSGNASEPLVASLYVPRNDKLVKIDGNLIIHSFLASEKAIARETGLAIPRDLSPALAIPEIRGNAGKHSSTYGKPAEQQRALTSATANSLKDHIKATSADGKLQQWFREGFAGPMLSSGLCTEVFQFEVSSTSPGAIIPASSVSNISGTHRKNATYLGKGRNRRILRGPPVPLGVSNFNSTEEAVGNSHKDGFGGNKTSSMVVSVLIDPREAGDSEVDGMITPKSLSRIFVVVLLDSIKYVTYSCILPRSTPHLTSA